VKNIKQGAAFIRISNAKTLWTTQRFPEIIWNGKNGQI
jgi:hypothetical protein